MHFPGERCLFLPGPKFLTETPKFLTETPKFLPSTHKFLTETPKFLPPAPKFLTETPKFLTETPKFLTETLPSGPKFLSSGPKFLTETPKFLSETPKFLPETLPPPPKFLPPHLDAFANTCHPLSVTKTPMSRHQSCPHPLSPPAATRASLPPKCLVLCPDPCETTRLLPLPRVSGDPRTPPAFQSPRGDQKRVARSLPPCAPRCPEPRKLRLPPCAVRSSASCRAGERRQRKVAKSPPRCPEMTSGYSAPLRGVTECPPQPGWGHWFVQEVLAQPRCSRGYPTQECVTLREEIPEGYQGKEGASKTRGSAQAAGKGRCAHPRPSRAPPAKRSAHGKKNRGAGKWLW